MTTLRGTTVCISSGKNRWMISQQWSLKEYAPQVLKSPQPINIDSLAEDCLYLSIKYKYISFDNKVLGLTTFGDVRIPCLDDFSDRLKLIFPKVQLLLTPAFLAINNILAGDTPPHMRFPIGYFTIVIIPLRPNSINSERLDGIGIG